MAFERPSLSQLVRRAKSDINSRLAGADANLRGSPEEVLAIAQAGLAHGLHGHLKWLSKQVLTDLAEDEFVVREASIYGLTKTPAVQAAGPISISGTNSTVCPVGTVWVRNDGARYIQNSNVTISGGSATPSLTAVNPGAAGNCVTGTQMTIASPVAGINSVATVTGGGITDGVDLESTDSLRARLIERKQSPPKGGGPGDYVAWAKQVSGVTRAWEYPLMLGPGTVGLTFVRDNDMSIIPDSGAVATVQAYVDLKRPITSDLTVFAPIAAPLNFTIHVSPNTSDVKSAVQAELQALLLRAVPQGASDGAGGTLSGTVLISQIREAIGLAAGLDDYVLTSPSADVTVSSGQLVTFGVIAWA